MRRAAAFAVVAALAGLGAAPFAAMAPPVRAKSGMVVAQDGIAAQIGADILRDGGTAVDAVVATAFALAVTLPAAGNIGGGGFLVVRQAGGQSAAYDFRETAPAGSSPTMFLRGGKYDAALHHNSHLAVGVPGTVAGLHLAWREQGSLPWSRLLGPAVKLAREGFVVSAGLAQSLQDVLPRFQRASAAAVAQFSRKDRKSVV